MPWQDAPMIRVEFRTTIEAAGFRIVHFFDPDVSPLHATAIRTSP